MGFGVENKEFDPLSIVNGMSASICKMRVPSNKDKRTAMEKLAARYVHRRFGVHQNVRDYPVPPRFQPWEEYFYGLLAREIRHVQPPEPFKWPVERRDESGLPLPPSAAYERVSLEVRYR